MSHVMTTVTFDIAAMGNWLESSVNRYAEIDRAYHEALEDAFWDDVETVEAFFQDIATQIRETSSSLVATPAPKTLVTCENGWYYLPYEDRESCTGYYYDSY